MNKIKIKLSEEELGLLFSIVKQLDLKITVKDKKKGWFHLATIETLVSVEVSLLKRSNNIKIENILNFTFTQAWALTNVLDWSINDKSTGGIDLTDHAISLVQRIIKEFQNQIS